MRATRHCRRKEGKELKEEEERKKKEKRKRKKKKKTERLTEQSYCGLS
jgi:hypothetical protein